MSKHSLAAGFVLQWLDDKGRARWELNRPAEEEKEGKKKVGREQRAGGRNEAWQTWAASGSEEKATGKKERNPPQQKVEVSPEEE